MYDAVQCLSLAHDLRDLRRVGAVVAADVDCCPLSTDEFSDDLLLLARELGSDRSEGRRQFRVLRLGCELLRPVQAQVEMAAAVVDRAELTAGRAVFLEEGAGCGIQGLGEDAGLVDTRAL